MELNELKDIHQGRGVIYAVVARFYLFAPSDEYYKMLEDILPGLLESVDDSSNAVMKDGVEALKKFVDTLTTLKDDELKEFKLENSRNYTSIFCLDARAPISASFYTSKDKLVMQESRDEVLRWFRKYGFKMNIDSNEPEDHLGCELMFLSHLADKLSNAKDTKEAKELIEDQIKFIKENILNWVPMLTKKMIDMSITLKFYLPLTYFIFGFLEDDVEFLKEISSEG